MGFLQKWRIFPIEAARWPQKTFVLRCLPRGRTQFPRADICVSFGVTACSSGG